MLDTVTAQKVLANAIDLGADFAELFVEKTKTNRVGLIDKKINEMQGGLNFGIGLRLIFGTKVLYGYTNSDHLHELLKMTCILSEKDKKQPQASLLAFNFSPRQDIHPASKTLAKDQYLDEKIAYLMTMDESSRGVSEKIVQFNGNIMQREQAVEIFNTEGLHACDKRHYTRLSALAIAQDGNRQSQCFEGPGGLNGWEFANQHDPIQLATKVGGIALQKLTAGATPVGKMPVIIGNGFGGVIFHEACGHSLETTAVAKKASVFWDKMQRPIANKCVSAFDDGTLENAWGSLNIDDEGMPTQKTQLIKDGILTSFMVDKLGAMKTGYARTGSARRESYRFAPASRMRNTFISPGKYSLEEMIASIDHGIYCSQMGGGSVKPGTGEFNFSAQESYLIKNGKIDRPLKAATLIGSGSDVLQKISMVGNNFAMAAGICGSVSGGVPVTVGQPALKVDDILVGGNA